MAENSRPRTVLRVVGVVLLLAGLVVGALGLMAFLDDARSEAVDGSFAPVLTIAAGGFLVVFGFGALNAGTLGAQARYAARETSPAVREWGSAFRGDPARSGEPGSSCPSCGSRAEGSFCSACGHALR